MQQHLDGRLILNSCFKNLLKNGDEFLVDEISLSNEVIKSHLEYLRKLDCLFVFNNKKIHARVQV